MSDDQETPGTLNVVTLWVTRPRAMDAEAWYPFRTAVEAAVTGAASDVARRWQSGPPAGQPSLCLAFTVPDAAREGLREELGKLSAEHGGVPLTWVEGTAELIPAEAEPPPAP